MAKRAFRLARPAGERPAWLSRVGINNIVECFVWVILIIVLALAVLIACASTRGTVDGAIDESVPEQRMPDVIVQMYG